MINKLYTYGCSFSFPFWIDEEETFSYILAKDLHCNVKNTSAPALCNDEIYHRFLNDISLYKKNDLIVYQFTSGYREGFTFLENNNFYYSTAGLQKTIEETNYILNTWGGGRDKYPFTDTQIETLIDYTNEWSVHKNFHRYKRVQILIDTLSLLIGFKYVFLFLDNSFDSIIDSKKCLEFECDNKKKCYSIMEWLENKKIRLSDYKSMPFQNDCHPSPTAHKLIAENILKFLTL